MKITLYLPQGQNIDNYSQAPTSAKKRIYSDVADEDINENVNEVNEVYKFRWKYYTISN